MNPSSAQHSRTTSVAEEQSQIVSTQSEYAPTPRNRRSGAYSVSESARPASLARVSSAELARGGGHGRSMSAMESSRRSKRFSMTFPINTSGTVPSNPPSPAKSTTSMSLPESVGAPTGPTDSAFLTAIAAQERRVLELREEVCKAEGELKRLKQEWALHEAQRKRHDARRLQQLQPLHMPSPAPSYHSLDDDPDGSSAWMQQEMERRKALMNGSKPSNRTTFSGSRHARTLSLLSPPMASVKTILQPRPKSNKEPSSRQVSSTSTMSDRSDRPDRPERPSHPSRVNTDEILTGEVDDTVDMNIDLGLPRDVLMKTGKQMATDFRDGLWTFIEDLRQATVGDEGINGTSTRTQGHMSSSSEPRNLRPQPSRGSLRPPARQQHSGLKRSSTTSSKRTLTPSPARSKTVDDSALLDVGGTFWKENGIEDGKIAERPLARKTSKKKLVSPKKETHIQDDSAESWDNWGSPNRSTDVVRSNSDASVSENQTSPSPTGTSPRTSVR